MVGRSHVRSHAISYDYRFHDHGITGIYNNLLFLHMYV